MRKHCAMRTKIISEYTANTYTVRPYGTRYTCEFILFGFNLDQICDENTTTQDLFDKVTKPIVESSVNGFNGTIFAYGQTSSGE